MRREQFGEAEFALDLEEDPTRLSYSVGQDRRSTGWLNLVGPIVLIVAYVAIGLFIEDEEMSGVANALLNAVPAILAALVFYWSTAELRFEHGAVVRVLGRFPPRFRTETPLSAFEGIAWWIDGDAPRNQPAGQRYAHVLELRHREPGRSTPIFRKVGGPRPLGEHAAYAAHFGLPALAPPVGRTATHPFRPDDLARRDWARDAPSTAPSPDRLVEAEEGPEESLLVFPFRPPGWFNEWVFGAGMVWLAIAAIVFLGWRYLGGLPEGTPGRDFHDADLYRIAVWGGVALLLAPFWIALAATRVMGRRRVALAVSAIGIDTQPNGVGENWLVAHEAIREVVEGRKSSPWTWRSGEGALYAVGDADAAPLAFRLDERTKSELVAALADAVLRWRGRPLTPANEELLEEALGRRRQETAAPVSASMGVSAARSALPGRGPGYLARLLRSRRER